MCIIFFFQNNLPTVLTKLFFFFAIKFVPTYRVPTTYRVPRPLVGPPVPAGQNRPTSTNDDGTCLLILSVCFPSLKTV